MGKRQVKEILKQIRRLCSRCDLGYELPPKRFGVEQTILLRRLELSPKDDFALCFTLSEALKYLESFYDDVRAQQKEVRKLDKALRLKALRVCTIANMSCIFTKRTRLSPPGFRIYDQVAYEQVLGPNMTGEEVLHVLKINQNTHKEIE